MKELTAQIPDHRQVHDVRVQEMVYDTWEEIDFIISEPIIPIAVELNKERDELLAALTQVRDWFESRAKTVSKGHNSSSWDLMELRTQRDLCNEVLEGKQ